MNSRRRFLEPRARLQGPIKPRFPEGRSVWMRLPWARSSRHNSSVLLPGVAWADEDLFGNLGHESVPQPGKLGGVPPMPLGKRGHQQQAAGEDRRLPRGGNSHSVKAAGRADHHRLGAPKKQIEALLLHRRVKPADDRNSRIAKVAGRVVQAKDHVAWAARRSEQRQERPPGGFAGSRWPRRDPCRPLRRASSRRPTGISNSVTTSSCSCVGLRPLTISSRRPGLPEGKAEGPWPEFQMLPTDGAGYRQTVRR